MEPRNLGTKCGLQFYNSSSQDYGVSTVTPTEMGSVYSISFKPQGERAERYEDVAIHSCSHHPQRGFIFLPIFGVLR